MKQKGELEKNRENGHKEGQNGVMYALFRAQGGRSQYA